MNMELQHPSMADLLSSLPPGLRDRTMVGPAEDRSQKMTISKTTSLSTFMRDLLESSAAPTDQLRAPPPSNEFVKKTTALSNNPANDAWERFCESAEGVRRLSWVEDPGQMCSKCCVRISEGLLKNKNLIYGKPVDNLLGRLISLQALCSTSYGVAVFTPWLSSSLRTLDLAFGPGIHDMAIVSCLLHVRRLCIHVSSLVITLDSSNCSQRRDGIIDVLLDVILAMPGLQWVSLPAELVARSIIDALADLQYLTEFIVMPATTAVVTETTYGPSLLFTPPDNHNGAHGVTSDLDVEPEGLAAGSNVMEPIIRSIVTTPFHILNNMETSTESRTDVATPNRRRVVSLPAESVTTITQERGAAGEANYAGFEVEADVVPVASYRSRPKKLSRQWWQMLVRRK